jgi:hypothetical protein
MEYLCRFSVEMHRDKSSVLQDATAEHSSERSARTDEIYLSN